MRFRFNEIELLVSDTVLQRLPDVASTLSQFAQHVSESEVNPADLVLEYNAATETKTRSPEPNIVPGLSLLWNKQGAQKPLYFHLDYSPSIAAIRSFPVPKQGAFNQALGKKTKVVLDTTGGWGNDALLMATQGYQVHVIERNPLMALMLREAFARLSDYITKQPTPLIVPTVIQADASQCVAEFAEHADCAYLDPMFPPKRKKSAAVNKQMQLLQWMIGVDLDAAELLRVVLDSPIKRAAVKRPDYAKPLAANPAQQFSSKLVHYDVYLQP